MPRGRGKGTVEKKQLAGFSYGRDSSVKINKKTPWEIMLKGSETKVGRKDNRETPVQGHKRDDPPPVGQGMIERERCDNKRHNK